jgi:malate dehydrogenase
MIMPCAAYLQGQYGVDGLFVGVPVRLGRNGIEQIVEVELSAEEGSAFQASAASVRGLVDTLAGLRSAG